MIYDIFSPIHYNDIIKDYYNYFNRSKIRYKTPIKASKAKKKTKAKRRMTKQSKRNNR